MGGRNYICRLHWRLEVVQFLLELPGFDAGLLSDSRETVYDMAHKIKDEV